MKIGILTFHFVPNYGAVLQAYATQTWLKNRGVDAYIINYVPPAHETDFIPKNIEKKCFNDFRRKPIRCIARWLRYKTIIEKVYTTKRNKFHLFAMKQLMLTPKINDLDGIIALNAGFSAIICGSDQIWNPEITAGFNSAYFCGFSDLNTKRISYAASVGDIDVINKKEYKKTFFELLKNFNNIAVREQTLADFISNESEIQPIVTLDPILLLEGSDYEKITGYNKFANIDYLLIYQLGPNSKATEVAKKIAKERHLKIIDICGDIYTRSHFKNMIYNAGPSEFLSLIKNASYIVTTSFHGTAFSIIYRKNFNSILSEKRNSRITDLLDSLCLENRIIKDTNDIFNTKPIDYSKPLNILEKRRAQSMEYLTNAITE